MPSSLVGSEASYPDMCSEDDRFAGACEGLVSFAPQMGIPIRGSPRDHTAPLVMVKNTFIDGWADEEEWDGEIPQPRLVATKSCPMPRVQHMDEEDEEEGPVEPAGPRFAYLLGRLPGDIGIKAQQLAVQHVPSGSASPDAFPAYVLPQQLAAELHSDPATAGPEEPQQQQQSAGAHTIAPHAVPLEQRTPEMSLGSELHEAGECRPCAWFWRPQGCQNGQECRHCHLCGDGEAKARRKSKLSSLRKQNRMAEKAAKATLKDEVAVQGKVAEPALGGM